MVELIGHRPLSKHEYGLSLRKFVHANLPEAGFKLGSLAPQASMLPIEPPLLVSGLFFYFQEKSFHQKYTNCGTLFFSISPFHHFLRHPW